MVAAAIHHLCHRMRTRRFKKKKEIQPSFSPSQRRIYIRRVALWRRERNKQRYKRKIMCFFERTAIEIDVRQRIPVRENHVTTAIFIHGYRSKPEHDDRRVTKVCAARRYNRAYLVIYVDWTARLS